MSESDSMSAVTAPPAPPSPRPRRLVPPGWLDLRLVLGVLLVLASVLIGARVVAGARHTDPALTTTRSLSAGTIIGTQDVRLARVQLPGHGRGVYLTRIRDAVGKRLARPISAGELLPSAALDAPAALTTVTVPLASGAAPDLHKGQRVEIWAWTKACAAVVLLSDVTVQAVHADEGSAISSGTGGQDVVISVAPELADRVVQALAVPEVQLRAGVLVGSPGAASSAPAAGAASCAAGQ